MEQSPFHVRGVIEGFYGAFYTFPERNDLIRFIGTHGYNLYVYGPKNDRQHRHHWWESYEPTIMQQFAETAAIAAGAGVRFCYAISPLDYDPAQDFPKLTRKINEMFNVGIRAFSLLVDDLVCVAHHRTNCGLCPWPAEIDIGLCNGLYEWLISLDPTCTLSMCPTAYHGRPPFNTYLTDLGAGLHPEIDIFYTGPDVCSPEITTADAKDFAEVARRMPLIWDNYPVNDLAMRPYMHLGPIRDREATLYQSVRGIVVNTMLQPEASKIPLLTWAEYFADPHGYEPVAAWKRALLQIGGTADSEALLRFAENSLHSCLRLPERPKLEGLANAATVAFQSDSNVLSSSTFDELNRYLNILDDACYRLKNRMENLRLRQELLPWVEALDEWIWVGKRTMRLLEAINGGKPFEHLARGVNNAIKEVQLHSKQTAGNSLLQFAQAALTHAETKRVRQEEDCQALSAALEPTSFTNGLAA